jgi:hypothetical protein
MNLAITEATLDSRPYDRAVVLHEFGHAVGLVHEHQSPASGGIRFDPEKTIAYFARLCGWSRQMTIDNVLTRYNEHDLKMFSDFDRKSIMLYQYPGEITVDGRGTEQNYVLSDTDKEFAAKLYDRPPPPKTDGGSTQPPVGTDPSAQTLTLDGPRVSGAITANASVSSFPFSISVNRTYTLVTDGYTQVALKLFKDNAPFDLAGHIRSLDLVNQVATLALPTGSYRVEIRHRYEGGIGEFGLRLITGGG